MIAVEPNVKIQMTGATDLVYAKIDARF